MNDNKNPNEFYPLTFAILNDLHDIVKLLKDKGDNMNKLHS